MKFIHTIYEMSDFGEEPKLKPGQLEEKRREKICCGISRLVYIFTILLFWSNIIIFIIDIAIKRTTPGDYFSVNRLCSSETIALACNTYFLTSDVFIQKMMLSGARLKDYTDGFYHIIVAMQFILRIIFYAVMISKLSICHSDYISGSLWQLAINAAQFALSVLSVYIPLFFVFLSMEPTKCFSCCIYRPGANNQSQPHIENKAVV